MSLPSPGFSPRFTISNAITAGLTQIERARGFLEAATLSDEWIRSMSQRALLLEAHHTTHIEGTQLSIAQAERLWAGEPEPGALPDDTRELLNYRDAFELVSDYLGGGQPITEGLIRQIHQRLVEGVRGGQGQPGRYRTIQNHIVNSATGEIIYTPPPPHEVAPMMQELAGWLAEESEIHPVLVAGIAQFQLVHIHPFVDGNGRSSRLLSTLCLCRSGYDFKRLFTLSEFYDRNRIAFYAALQEVRRRDMDLTGWLEYFVKGLETQLGEVVELGKGAIRADLIAKTHRLNGRQERAIEHLMRTDALDISGFQALFPDVSRRTLQRDLARLEEGGLIQHEGQTNRLTYRLASNL